MDDPKYNQSSAFLDSQVYATREKLRVYSDLPRKGNDMGCLGVHFALTEAEAKKLKELKTERVQLLSLEDELEAKYFGGVRDLMCESDKAWDGIHRALTDGELGYENGDFPQSHVILGGEPLYDGDEYVMSLKTPDEVRETAEWLSTLSVEEFRVQYFKIDAAKYGFSVDDESFKYCWHWLERLRTFYERAASENRYVLFTATQ